MFKSYHTDHLYGIGGTVYALVLGTSFCEFKSHIPYQTKITLGSMRKSKYTKEILEPVVKESVSWCEVLEKFGLKITSGNNRHIRRVVMCAGIDYSHFTGKAWSKGKTAQDSVKVLNIRNSVKTPDDILFSNPSKSSSGTLRKRLVELGVSYVCSICGIYSWLDNPITLHLDHIDGNHSNNLKENLRFLCPNCHQQTDTWGIKNNAL